MSQALVLPPELLGAVAAPGGGKITLVVGAGCSLEAPTSIPLSATCAEQCHDRLVADGVLGVGDCEKPSNLSSLADAVVKKTGGQKALVVQLSEHYALEGATPNEGHLLAAALLREGSIASIVTLNFDLALSTAIAHLGAADAVGIIDGPADLPNQKPVNLYYLHRNVNAANPDDWILRTAALTTEWKEGWEKVVAAKVLSTPVLVFAGLGSPADVLIESTKLIQNTIPSGSRAFQVDPGTPDKSEFFKALSLEPAAFIQAKWCDFMAALSQRLVVKQTQALKAASDIVTTREHLTPEDVDPLLGRLQAIGLLQLGHLRASWLLHEKLYYPEEPLAREMLVDLLLGIAMVARVADATAVLFEDGVVEFRRGNRIVSSYVLASGRGSRSRGAIESQLSVRARGLRGRAAPPTGAVVAGTRPDGINPVTVPLDILVGDTSENIAIGSSALRIVHVDSLRHDEDLIKELVP
jgi:hypothetical protein